MSKLWSKDNSINKEIEKFTIGKDAEIDVYLAEYDIQGSIAHSIMLYECEIISKKDLQEILQGLFEIYTDVKAGNFSIQPGIEDVHSQVEILLTEKIGDAGKRMHTARSRNDQVLVDLKMYYRQWLLEIADKTEVLIRQLVEASEKYKDILMPGYTHMQVAMPSSFGLWLGGYAETLIQDYAQIRNVLEVINYNPLGSAAGYGSSFPINRKRTSELLQFKDLEYNSISASMNRGKTEYLIATALSSASISLGKFCMDICLYNSQNFGFLTLPDEYTTGSSIMPHKKNPDVFELLRAKFNNLTALPAEIATVLQNLPTGYHRDYQLLKEVIFPKLSTFESCINILTFVIDKIEVKDELMKSPVYSQAFSVEMIKEKVDKGMPFRDAYLAVKKELEQGMETQPELNHTHEGSIGNLQNDNIIAKLEDVKLRFTEYDFSQVEKNLKGYKIG